jgi:hypothetical protein
MNGTVKKLWPELEWIMDGSLREKTARTWEIALDRSVLKAEDLDIIPFTLLCGPDLNVSFMTHKRCVVHIARAAGEKMNEFFGNDLPVQMDVLISGAILGMWASCLNTEWSTEKLSRKVRAIPEASLFRVSLLRMRCSFEVYILLPPYS